MTVFSPFQQDKRRRVSANQVKSTQVKSHSLLVDSGWLGCFPKGLPGFPIQVVRRTEWGYGGVLVIFPYPFPIFISTHPKPTQGTGVLLLLTCHRDESCSPDIYLQCCLITRSYVPSLLQTHTTYTSLSLSLTHTHRGKIFIVFPFLSPIFPQLSSFPPCLSRESMVSNPSWLPSHVHWSVSVILFLSGNQFPLESCRRH